MTAADGAELAIDIGGTFTDVALRCDQRLLTIKVLTTHEQPADGVLKAVATVLESAASPPAAITRVIHGTTLATNALIERRGARTALITTRGHRDILAMAHENRFEQYDISVDRSPPLVPRELRLPVTERMAADGAVLEPLDETTVHTALAALDAAAVESVAVGLLHAWVNPAHEERIGALLQDCRPHLSITLSADVCPEIREYERLSTACANAYIKPLMGHYLQELEQRLRAAEIAAPLFMMTSGGGLTTLAAATRYPIRLVESGPAGGAILAAAIARDIGLDQVLSFDMGGTTAKICMIDGGAPQLSRAFEVDRSWRFRRGSGLPVRIPVIEMVEIGAGGGSIASVDRLGRVQIGPASAGSEPGPAAYGRGGSQPTVTDADLVLGRLDSQRFAGGRISLDMDAARTALQRDVGRALATTAADASWAISEVVDENMAAAARAHATEWGLATTDRTLIAFGGAAPLHAARVALALHIDHIIIPASAGVGSAVGFLLAPLRFEVVRSHYQQLSTFAPESVNHQFEAMRAEAEAVLAPAAGDAARTADYCGYMRYVGQGQEIAVDLPARPLRAGDEVALRQLFEATYGQLYGRIIPGLDVEVLSWTLSLCTFVAAVPRLPPPETAPVDTAGPAQVYNGKQFAAAAVVARTAVGRKPAAGPALIAEAHTTTVVPAGFHYLRDAFGHLHLQRAPQDKTPQ